jgi:hypothetical protein
MNNNRPNAVAVDAPVKRWYQSKIVLLAVGFAALLLGDLVFGFITPNVTPEQLDSFQTIYPAGAEIVQQLKSGKSVLEVAGSIFALIIAAVRIWFTGSLIPQSLNK